MGRFNGEVKGQYGERLGAMGRSMGVTKDG